MQRINHVFDSFKSSFIKEKPLRKTSDSWLNRNEVIPVGFENGNVKSAICLTLYNESEEMLSETIQSIALNYVDLINQNRNGNGITICIIADGIEQLSQSVLEYAERLGVYFDGGKMRKQADGLHIVESKVKISELIFNKLKPEIEYKIDPEIRILFCVKGKNAGKLDSHWWFYEKVCPYLSPEICFQVDVGTTLDKAAIYNMYRCFENNAAFTTAAVASTVLLDCDKPLDLHASFQCGEFAIEKSLIFPSEELFGYLSVIPGQFSGVLWSAMQGQQYALKTPKSQYLKGMKCESGFEKTKFLAEDRVLGYELLADEKANNRLVYAPSAVAYTDKCESLNELLKQRRRWVNSSFICRTWMMKNIFEYAKHPALSMFKQMQVYASSLNLLAYQWLDLFMPLLSFLLLQQTAHSLSIHVGTGLLSEDQKWVVLIAIAIGWYFPTLYAVINEDKKQRKQLTKFIFLCATLSSMAILAINIAASSWLPLLFILAIITIVAFQCLLLDKGLAKNWLKSAFQYMILVGPIKLMQTSYAFLNINDSSWGTKGLDKNTDVSSSMDTLNQSLRKLRVMFLSVWFVSNVMLIAFAFTVEGFGKGLLVLFGLVAVFIFTAGLLGNLLRFIKPMIRKQNNGQKMLPSQIR